MSSDFKLNETECFQYCETTGEDDHLSSHEWESGTEVVRRFVRNKRQAGRLLQNTSDEGDPLKKAGYFEDFLMAYPKMIEKRFPSGFVA